MAGRYATALFELALEENALDQVARDLSRFDQALGAVHDLYRLVKSPVFSAEEQQRAIAAILAQMEIEGLTANFLKLIAKNRRLFAAPDMINAGIRIRTSSSPLAPEGMVRQPFHLVIQPVPCQYLKRLDGACSGFAQGRLELGERLLDRVEVGRVRGKKTQGRSDGLDHFVHAVDFVGAQVVQEDDVAFLGGINRFLKRDVVSGSIQRDNDSPRTNWGPLISPQEATAPKHKRRRRDET